MNVEEAILELDIEQTIKELAIVCGYLQQEYKKQKELIDKIKEQLKNNISVHEDEIWGLIKEYEDENNNI